MTRAGGGKSVKAPRLNFGDYELFTGLSVPDPITFVTSPEWLNRPQLYPRQATLLKVIFLRNDLLTDYDHAVIDEWEASFKRTGDNGILTDIRGRMQYLRDNGHKWFREVQLVMGRRAGKGYVAALAMAYIVWNYMATGNPQAHYGISQDKKLHLFVYAGKKEQATVNLWRDVHDAIMAAPCFTKYINRAQGESLTIKVPHDFITEMDMKSKGVSTDIDTASIRIVPKEATLMSGRGPTSFIQAYDEFAHVVATGANRSAAEVWKQATPSLDQFKKDAFIIQPSSPWEMTGQFYTNWLQSQELDEEGNWVYPEKMMIQLASWEIYFDWEVAHEIEMFPREFEGDLKEYTTRNVPFFSLIKSAPQEFDEGMQKLKKADPDMFRVERESKWQTTLDAYLDAQKIDAMFEKGDQDNLRNVVRTGPLNEFYVCHIDPSETNANFGMAVGHTEPGPDGFDICVFDYITHWDPADFDEHTIDYTEVMKEVARVAYTFPVDVITSDQFGFGPVHSLFTQEVRKNGKNIMLSKATATAARQKETAEGFKLALNQGWIKAPYYEQADLELKFLRLKNNKVVEQETGPVVTKDVAACMFEVVFELLGSQISAYRDGLAQPILGGNQGGVTPFAHKGDPADVQVFSQFSSFMQRGARSGQFNPDRGGRIARDIAMRTSGRV